MQLTSDLFFGVALEDREVCEEVIGIITGLNLQVLEVTNQHTILNLAKHSIIMDIYGKLHDGKYINLEMHPQSGENRVKRIRYNVSSMDVDILRKSENYKSMPDIYAIYITKADFLRTKKAINYIKRIVDGTAVGVENGIHEYYVCLSNKAETAEQQALLEYIQNSDGIKESEYFPKLVRRVRYLKEGKRGVEIMCEIFDEGIKPIIERERIESEKRGHKEERRSIVIKMMENNLPEEIICVVAALTKKEVQEIRDGMC